VKLVISDAHEGLKAAIRRVFGAAWQRCRVHWVRNALSYVAKTQQSIVAAALRQAFIQPDRVQARCCVMWPTNCGRSGRSLRRSSTTVKTDVLSYLDFPEHQPAGAAQQRGQASGRRCRHLSQRGINHPADRRSAAGTKRRVWTTPICKDNYAAMETGLAVVYPALSRGYTAAGPDGIRGSAAGQMAELESGSHHFVDLCRTRSDRFAITSYYPRKPAPVC
jgi:hypothetical protein